MGRRLIGRQDEDISQAVREIVEAEGRLNAKTITLAKHHGRVCVHVDCTEGAPEIFGSHVLLAVGRIPNTGDLSLEKPGLGTDGHG